MGDAHLWIQAVVVAIFRIAVIVGHRVHVLEAAIPGGVPAECALVVDAPCEDLVVVCERDTVHAASGDFDDADRRGAEVWIKAWALDIDGIFCSAETEFSSGPFSEYVHI